MFRIDRKISVMLSYIFCALSFFGVLLLAIALPFFRSANVPFLRIGSGFGAIFSNTLFSRSF